ncbi:hypothetical protein [Marivirga sp.]|uniref:hypothetical protein n=1 Tax=Marivirga sp. TaxID=2018662 RepID=UPI002D7EB58A|nr:hypothetical protein [Marivirga sp.]HET8861139.1 hypothetical protein [Marivirga sp.]
MIRVLWIGLFFILLACDSNSKKFNHLENDLRTVSSNFNQLEGRWSGNFQKLNPTFDTVYYIDLKEKIEYQLSGTISDSSLVKSISLKDTFDILPITIHIFNIDSMKLTAEAKISCELFERQIPLNADISQNLRGLKIIHFGEIEKVHKSQDALSTEISTYQYKSLQSALTSKAFQLELKKQSNDSLVFGLPYGYGLIKVSRL